MPGVETTPPGNLFYMGLFEIAPKLMITFPFLCPFSTTGVASFYEFFETIAPAFGIYDWGINLENYRATVANGEVSAIKRPILALQQAILQRPLVHALGQ